MVPSLVNLTALFNKLEITWVILFLSASIRILSSLGSYLTFKLSFFSESFAECISDHL